MKEKYSYFDEADRLVTVWEDNFHVKGDKDEKK